MGPLRPVVRLWMIRLAVLAVILWGSIASARRERHRLLDELAATARQQTHASNTMCCRRGWTRWTRTRRLLTDLVEGPTGRPSPEHDSAHRA